MKKSIRILSTCLALIFVLASFAMTSISAEEEKEYLARLDFNTYNSYAAANSTGAAITDQATAGISVASGVLSIDNTQKALVRIIPQMTTTTLDATKTLVVEGDYYVTADTRFYVTLHTTGLSNNFVNLFLIRLNKIYDFTAAGESTDVAFSKDTWYNIKVVINLATQTKDLYVNGVKKVEGANLLPTADMGKTVICDAIYAINTANDNGTTKMDNFAMYYSKVKSNIDPYVYLGKSDFENLTVGQTLDTATNKEFYELPTHYEIVEENGDKIFRTYLDSTTGNGAAIALETAKDKTTKVVFEEKIRWINNGNNDAAFCPQFAADTGSYQNLTRIKVGSTGLFDTTSKESGVPSLKANTWYVFKFILDPATGVISIYIDGNLYGTGSTGKTNTTVNRRFCFVKVNTQDKTSTISYVDCSYAKVYYLPAETSIVGYQKSTSVTNDKYSVRIVGTLDALTYDKVGYEISASYGDSQSWTKDVEVHNAYTSITNGNASYSATDFAYGYLTAIHINNIPVSTGTITLTVKPYVIINSVKSYGEAKTFTVTAPSV